MVQRRNRAGLLVEPADRILGAGQLSGEDLEGGLAPRAGILREVDLAHTAGAERRDDAVVRILLSDAERVHVSD